MDQRDKRDFNSRPMFAVYLSMGSGLRPGPRFRLLVDAKRFVTENRRRGSFAILEPNGNWHTWPSGEVILPRRNPASATFSTR